MIQPLRLTSDSAEIIRTEIERAGGREVCFLASVSDERMITSPRAVARGNRAAVLAAARDAVDGEIMLHNHPSGTLEPSDADLAVASHLYEMGVGTAIVDNRGERLYVVVEPPRPKVRTPLDTDQLEEIIGPSGPLATLHPAYENRPGQREVLRTVASGYGEGGVSVIEAGTGTGKSLAYLIPAAAWALQNDERTVISTNTINLQEQLVAKDLPLVRDLLGDDVRWAMVKGRGNYISIRRAHLAQGSSGDLFEEERTEEIANLMQWIRSTEDGSLADLPFVPSDEVWDEVRSDSDVCLRTRCPHFQDCFFQRSRRVAAAAPLLVTNHHLLFADLAVRRSTSNFNDSAVLPAYRHIVLDEAHNVEDAATLHLGVEISRRGLFRTLSRLERRGRGVLQALHKELGRADDSREVRDLLDDRVRPSVEEARDRLALFLDEAENLLPPHVTEATRIGDGHMGEPTDHEPFNEALEAVLGSFRTLGRGLGQVRDRVLEDPFLAERVEGRLLDLSGSERRLAAGREALTMVFRPAGSASAWVRWIERRGKRPRQNLVFAVAPVEPGSMLRESLFGQVESAALLSATLTTRQGFGFVRGRLGLGDASGGWAVGTGGGGRVGAGGTPPGGAVGTTPVAIEELPDDAPAEDFAMLAEPLSEFETARLPFQVRERMVESPFDYATQTLLCVPTDLAKPSDGEAFFEDMARTVTRVAHHTDGGLFALFTSHRSLRRVSELLRLSAIERTWPLFVQGDAHRSQLLEEFARSGRGILLGTSSFWEGVDVPGDPLRGLIIEKLPFKVPTEPVTAARVEALESAGRDAFQEYSLPIAALKLKQGFGRLIRSRTDRGAVVLLDSRIVTRRYGRYLLDSLPPARFLKGGWRQIDDALARFYDDH